MHRRERRFLGTIHELSKDIDGVERAQEAVLFVADPDRLPPNVSALNTAALAIPSPISAKASTAPNPTSVTMYRLCSWWSESVGDGMKPDGVPMMPPAGVVCPGSPDPVPEQAQRKRGDLPRV